MDIYVGGLFKIEGYFREGGREVWATWWMVGLFLSKAGAV